MNNKQKELAEYILYIGKLSLEDRKDKLIEELSELIRALIKDDKENIIEEIADVQILLYEYIKKAENKRYINDMIDYKLNRYWRILDNEKNY